MCCMKLLYTVLVFLLGLSLNSTPVNGKAFQAVSSPSPGARVLQLTGTTELDYFASSLKQGLTGLARLSGTGLVLAGVLTSWLWLSWTFVQSVATEQRDGEHKRKSRPTLSRKISRILSYVSSNSLDDLIDTIKPAMEKLDMLPKISRMGTGAIESVGSMTNLMSDSVSGGIHTVSDSVTGGIQTMSTRVSDSLQTVSDTADTLSRVVSDKKLKDCLLQAVCYLTPADATEEGEGRKNKDKQERREKEKKEKQERKKKKKKKNKKQEVKDYEDMEINTEIPDEKDIDDDTIEIDSEECEVFQCDIVGYGYTAYKVFDKLKQFKERLDNLNRE